MAMQQLELAQALGIHPSVVTRDKARGMPVDSLQAAQDWRRLNVRPRIKMGDGPPSAPSAPPPPAAEGGEGDYWQSRSRREKAEADMAELKLAEQLGQLVRADAVRSAWAKRTAGMREALLQIPSRLSAVLAAESSQARCHDALQQELHAVLQQLVAD
jgi:hypothetical protein